MNITIVYDTKTGKYLRDKHRALFIGYIPTPTRNYLLGVYIDEPEGYNYYGGAVAAPVFAKSIRQILKLNQ